jgi:sensor histidine kinase YesM
MKKIFSKNKINNKNILLLIAITLVLGGFFSFILLTRIDSITKALIIGYYYAAMFILVTTFIQKVVINKLQVLNLVQQWSIRTFIYIISISAVYLSGLILQMFIVSPGVSFGEFISDTFWSSFANFIASPLDAQLAGGLFQEQLRAVLIPFFTIIILIGLISLLGSYVELRWQQNKQQQVIDRAQLTALKAQIEPHFLFNSLNTIASKIKDDPDKAEELILKLSDILRYLFQNAAQEVIPLKEEINFLKKYIDLMQARYDNRLEVKWHQTLNDTEIRVPVLLLQPLVENALSHAWSEKSDRLLIKIVVKEKTDSIVLTVEDNGMGIEANRLKSLPVNGHALANINGRLKLLYKQKDLLTITSEYQKGTVVSISIPKELR